MKGTASTLILSSGLTNEQRYILSLQSEVIQQPVINSLYFLRPIRLTIIGTALMKQNALNHSLLLGNFRHINKPFIGIVTVGSHQVL